MKRIRTLWALVFLVLVGCAHNPPVLQPGAYNQFDQSTYKALRVAQATLEQAAKDVATLPVTHPLRVGYNAAIDAYDAAEAGYRTYHAALDRGEAGNQAAVTALLQGLNAAVARYVATKAKPTAEVRPWTLQPGLLQGWA